GTDLEGRCERLLGDVRSRWTPDLGDRALRAIAELQERADALEASLNRAVTGLRSDITALHATVNDVRAALADDEALIELVSYRAVPPAGEATASRHYGAFVVDKTDLRWTDLGPAAPIDASVADLLDAAQDWSTS